uniref:CSON012957 protein n=1 Tax=Culicoides sonorensis TaxID=179676 RepID=A0A336MB19_CULSO
MQEISDSESVHKHDCRLGINKNTATLIPLFCLFLLMSHLDVVNSTNQKINVYQFTSQDTPNEVEEPLLTGLDPKCRGIRAGVLSEVLDVEDRDLLKDTRTSFIPSQPLIIPAECQQKDISVDANDRKTEEYQKQINKKTLNFLRKKRHELQIDFHHPPLITSTSPSSINDDGNTTEVLHELPDEPLHVLRRRRDSDGGAFDTTSETRDVLWNTENTEKESKPELDETEKISCTNCRPKVVSLNSFWKGEGTREKIRSTQAEIMKQYIDNSVDPCVDFYQYACGNWEKLNPIPKDKAAYDTFEKLRESLDTVLRDLLLEEPKTANTVTQTNSVDGITSLNIESTENPPQTQENHQPDSIDVQNALDLIARYLQNHNPESRLLKRLQNRHDIHRKRRELDLQNLDGTNEAETKARNLFISCMNYELLEKRGVEPILDLAKSLGGWPVLDPHWNESAFDWLNLTAHLRLHNNDIFIVEWVGPDIKSSDENVIQFDQTSLGLPTREYFLKDSNKAYLEAYREYMITVINILGADYANAVQASNEIVEFEIRLANITSAPEERSNVSVLYRRKTLKSLTEEIPQIDWQKYLTIVLGQEVSMNETVVMFATDYMKDLVALIEETEPRIVANYLMWRFIRHRVNNVDDSFNEAKQKFYFTLFGREESPPRWKNCVNQVNSNMGMAVGAMFVRKYFDENSKRDTMAMTNELQQTFREILNSTEWIDIATKHLAELKVNAMSLRIGYPDFILSHEDLNDKYKDLEINPDKYFENTLNVLKHLTRTEQSKLRQAVNKTAWNTAPAVVNAYYSRNKNQIMFPAGILQPPFYHRYFPKSLNYGGIGVVIGHELTHGFDDKGRLFDREGNLHRWWSEDAIKEFHNRAQCLINQYGNYTVQEVGIAVDGENTQGENIADNGGIKQAYQAYKQWLDQQTDPEVLENEILPELNMSSTQLFFLNFAQVWCGAMRPEASRNKLKTAVHSPGKFRVIGTLSNSPDFAKEFNCPAGSPMNPTNKCKVW